MLPSYKFEGSNGKVLYSPQIVDLLTSGCPSISHNVNEDITLDFANMGDIAHLLLIQSDTTITINPGVMGQFQVMRLIIKNAKPNVMVSFSDNVNFGDNPPYISSKKGGVSILSLCFDGYKSIYGRQVLNG